MLAPTLQVPTDAVRNRLTESFATGNRFDDPYPHWIISNLFTEEVVDALVDLPFEAPALKVSGTREVNNESRRYFNEEARRIHPVVSAVTEAFQGRDVVNALERTFNASLAHTYLRIEYAQDTGGFWLAPHTDIGPKKITLLIYLSRNQAVESGTDVYHSKERHCKTVPYRANTGLVFVPSDRTWHGFEKRPITGIRKSVIVNYVTDDWRARDQLSYQDTPVY